MGPLKGIYDTWVFNCLERGVEVTIFVDSFIVPDIDDTAWETASLILLIHSFPQSFTPELFVVSIITSWGVGIESFVVSLETSTQDTVPSNKSVKKKLK